ncbi:MAG: hypothetical protein AAEF23_03930 [Gammaproteobacteria bacterium]
MRKLYKFAFLLILAPSIASAWGVYTKQVDVFGITIIATDSVADEKLLHAANVMAAYLDNNQDGKADDIRVIDAMVSRHAYLFMSGGEFEQLVAPWPSEGFREAEEFGQNLFADETRPYGSNIEYGFDATLEEVLHLISHVGYANVYPKKFGEQAGSELTSAMDSARGGRFMQVPKHYPENAWYTYDDDSCNYNCMATEYFYWALTSLLGAQSYIGREDEIKHEWRLSSASMLKSTDKPIYQLLSTLPIKTIPTGKYAGSLLTIKSID